MNGELGYQRLFDKNDGADGEIRTPATRGHRISNPARYQAMRRPQQVFRPAHHS